MRLITVPSTAIALRADKPLTPAMTAAIWEIAAAVDRARFPADTREAHWLAIPSVHLRGENGRADNVWLRECLDRLTGVKISGEWRGDQWGAVLVAQWEIVEGGSMVQVLIPPAGIHALRTPQNFAKIEARAAHSLTGHGRQLYLLLADKKRLGQPYWTFPLDELRALMGVADRLSYDRWSDFRARVLDPALEAVNDYGTVSVTMTPEKRGRSVHAVTFRWRWKDPHDAADTAAQNERHKTARRRRQADEDAPPMIVAPGAAVPHEPVKPDPEAWWQSLSPAEQDAWADQVGRTFEISGKTYQRRTRDIAAQAFDMAQDPERPAMASRDA